jgi:predicted nucleic acid-binding protein
MSATAPNPLMVDTGAFYARLDEDDANHETAADVFRAIRDDELPYRPVFTTQSILSELATLALYKLGHRTASRGFRAIRESESFNVLPVDRSAFAAAAEQFVAFDDQTISFVDHTTSVIADRRDVEHVFGFDDDFATLGLTRVPGDTE